MDENLLTVGIIAGHAEHEYLQLLQQKAKLLILHLSAKLLQTGKHYWKLAAKIICIIVGGINFE